MVQSTMNPPPPLTALSDLDAQLRSAGYAVLDAASLTRTSNVALQQLNAWVSFWDALPPDAHLRDGGRYRRRRHGSFIVDCTMQKCRPQAWGSNSNPRQPRINLPR